MAVCFHDRVEIYVPAVIADWSAIANLFASIGYVGSGMTQRTRARD